MAPGDPDVRLSMWHALCHWCPDRPDGRGGLLGPPTYTGMALTTDGYETATYVRHTFSNLVSAVHSPRDDVFLVADLGNGREWLVEVDGTVRRVQRVETELRPTDPRLWFEWAGQVAGPPPGARSTWTRRRHTCGRRSGTGPPCRRTAASSRGAGRRRARGRTRNPASWSRPGGTTTAPGIAESSPPTPGETSLSGSPAGDLADWTWHLGDGSVDLHTGRDRGATGTWKPARPRASAAGGG